MAETYKNINAVLSASMVTIYTVPTGKAAVIVSLQCANINATTAQTVSAQILDASNSNAVRRLVLATSIPINGAIDVVVGKLFLEAGDAIQMQAGNASQVEVVGSALEIN